MHRTDQAVSPVIGTILTAAIVIAGFVAALHNLDTTPPLIGALNARIAPYQRPNGSWTHTAITITTATNTPTATITTSTTDPITIHNPTPGDTILLPCTARAITLTTPTTTPPTHYASPGCRPATTTTQPRTNNTNHQPTPSLNGRTCTPILPPITAPNQQPTAWTCTTLLINPTQPNNNQHTNQS